MSATSPEISFPQYFVGPHGEEMKDGLQAGIDEFTDWWQNEQRAPFRGITVAMYSFNDSPEAVERAFEGIGEQLYVDPNALQTVFIDAGTWKSPENTRARGIAKDYGATIGSVAVGPHFRPDLLNKGLELADYQHVVSMSAHSVPATNVMFAAGRRLFEKGPAYAGRRVGGVYGVPLPDENASWIERMGAHRMGATERVTSETAPKEPGGAGYLDASCSMVDKNIVREIGRRLRPESAGYLVEFGAGGMDGYLGEQMDSGWYINPETGRSERLYLLQERLMAVHHTHGLGIIRAPIQLASWLRMSKARDYNPRWGFWHPHRGL